MSDVAVAATPVGVAAGTLRAAEREFVVFSKMWRGTLFTSVANPLFFLGALGLGLGGIIDERSAAADQGAFLQFLAPGLMAASVFQNAAFSTLWPVMAGTTWIRTFHGMVASPIPPAAVYGGVLINAVVFRGLTTSIPFLVTAALLGGVPSWWGILAIPAAMLGALAAAAPLAAYAATQESDAGFSVIVRIVVMPLFLFSGTFFPVSQLPDWLERLAVVSPLWHAVELTRSATLGDARIGAVLVHVAVLLALAAVGAVWGPRTFAARLTP